MKNFLIVKDYWPVYMPSRRAGLKKLIHAMYNTRIWRSENQGTHGCIAMEEKNLQLLLQWLDKSKNPSILIISKTTLNS